ncbi:hypothetical protein [Paractinoplanes lichenicola]|uniref:Lipoprotein n=1 Tax=Paractinoplanes lichenicola TaxID=2802976 RepID=A0ABS1VEZ2_9ACTN|nr:hypothetical protein [Actinoplanes lichenicola]MBL7253262.1 hypothetical protein [Actinoplanes lichenicola]
MSLRPLRRALPLLLVAATAAACSSNGRAETPPASSPPSAVAAAGSAPSPSAAQTIPASAFFQMPGDMKREQQKADGATAVPKLCGRELAAGKGVVASAALMNLYQAPEAPEGSVPQGILYQTIRSYEGDSAAAFMDRARDGLAACKSYKTAENTVKVQTKPLPGTADEALHINLVQPQLDLPGNPTGGTQTNTVVVLRFGSVITILNDAEYERSSSDHDFVLIFTDEATKAIRSWRG